MSKEVVVRSNGIGIFGMLGILFVALKLMGHITWSWWLVTLPFWGPFVLFICLVVFIGIATVLLK